MLTVRKKLGEPFTTFNVRIHVKTADNRQVFTGHTSETVWNTYGLSKRRGVIQPKVDSEIYARRETTDYSGVFRITNLERERIRFELIQIEVLYDDPEHLSTPRAPEKSEWALGPMKTLERTFTVSRKHIPLEAFGFAAHLHGHTEHTKLSVLINMSLPCFTPYFCNASS